MKLTSIVLFLLSLFTFSSYSFSDSREITDIGKLRNLPEATKLQLVEILKRHSGGSDRPDSCPLESKQNIDILGKINNIKTLFKDDCLDKDQSRLDEVLQGAESIQAELDKISKEKEDQKEEEAALEVGSISPAEVDVAGVILDGKQVADIFGGISKIYDERSCKGLLDNSNLLEKTSDMIVDIAKIGLLVPNTQVLFMAGGGIALSSVLNIINNLFNNRFNFEKTEDRQSFIKLNCAFYDIRKDIEKSGFLDVKTHQHEKDKDIVADLVKKIEEEVKLLNKSLSKIEKTLEEDRSSFLFKNKGQIFKLSLKLKKNKKIFDKDILTNIDKLHFIEKISQAAPILISDLKAFMKEDGSTVAVFDSHFLKVLNSVNYQSRRNNIEKYIDMDFKEFKTSFVENILFHFERLIRDSEKDLDKLEKTWMEITEVEGVSLKDFYKNLKKDFKKKEEVVSNYLLKIKNVDARIKRILKEDGFTSRDDGSENIVNILSDYDQIVGQIYGKFGYKFLKYTTNKSIKENEDFKDKFEKFKKDHLIESEEKYKIPNVEELRPLRRMFACQDAMPYRRKWKFAESLAQQGYDFVATNADLFHADIKRVWLGRSGDRSFGIHRFLSKYEKIQQHHKSSIFALQIINNQDVPSKYISKYLKKKYLGKAMIEVDKTKAHASLIQELIESFDCQKATQMD